MSSVCFWGLFFRRVTFRAFGIFFRQGALFNSFRGHLRFNKGLRFISGSTFRDFRRFDQVYHFRRGAHFTKERSFKWDAVATNSVQVRRMANFPVCLARHFAGLFVHVDHAESVHYCNDVAIAMRYRCANGVA